MGKRPSMEDFFDVKSSEIDGQRVCMFGIFDGQILLIFFLTLSLNYEVSVGYFNPFVLSSVNYDVRCYTFLIFFKYYTNCNHVRSYLFEWQWLILIQGFQSETQEY